MNYEPGTVAEVTWDNASLAKRQVGESDVSTERAILTADDRWSLASGWDRCIEVRDVSDVRPLVVLDLDDAAHCLTALRLAESQEQSVTARLLLHSIIGKIEAQTKPPRIPEPGLYGVVEATVDGADRRRFCHLEDDGEGWSGAGAWFYWRDLTDPKLIRPGIEDES